MSEVFRMKIDGQMLETTPDNLGVALFWDLVGEEDMDYFDYHVLKDGEDEESHLLCFNPLAARWMGGIALRNADQRELRLTERNNGTFYEQSGWHPQVYIEQTPTEWEKEMYTQHILGKDLDDPAQIIGKLLKEDLEDEA